MTLAHALAQFAVVAGVLTLTPGIDTALVLRQALTGTRRSAMATAVGIGTGCLVWGVAAAVGVSALVTASPVAFSAVKVAGALYLLHLGLGLWWGALHPSPQALDDAGGAVTGRAAFTKGLFTNLLNPKVGVLYVAVLPQFLTPGHNPAVVGALMAGIHFTEGIVWMGVVTVAAHALRQRLASARTTQVIDAVTGTVLVAFGAHLIASAL